MSGHSKWKTIKRKKGAADAKRGALFTKLAREIQIAARESADVEYNFRLRLAVDKAKANSMPKENIERAIRRGSGAEQADELVEIAYEGYGPGGVARLSRRRRARARRGRRRGGVGVPQRSSRCTGWRAPHRACPAQLRATDGR